MNFWVQPWNFTLLSKDRQDWFSLSWKAKKDVYKGVQEICTYVRNILPWSDLGRIAHNLQ